MHDTNVGNSAGLDTLQCGISCIVQNCLAHSIYIQQYYGERSMHKTRLKSWWPAWAKEKLVMPGFVVPSPVILSDSSFGDMPVMRQYWLYAQFMPTARGIFVLLLNSVMAGLAWEFHAQYMPNFDLAGGLVTPCVWSNACARVKCRPAESMLTIVTLRRRKVEGFRPVPGFHSFLSHILRICYTKAWYCTDHQTKTLFRVLHC